MDKPPEISPALESAINDLLFRDRAIIEVGKRNLTEEFFLPDLFVESVLNRALQLLHGFVATVWNRNYMNATPERRVLWQTETRGFSSATFTSATQGA
jgi:hypothetical protein